MLKRVLTSGGAALGLSALVSKGLGLIRDRSIIDIFDPQSADLIFAAFRLPDFFFYLLVGATISVLFIPRSVSLKDHEKQDYFSSFFWGIVLGFGSVCLLGVFLAPWFVAFLFSSFEAELQLSIIDLARLLFGSVFVLSLSSLFGAELQSRERFYALATAPLFYMGAIVCGIFLFQDQFGVLIVGYSAITGALLHLSITSGAYFIQGKRINFSWKKPGAAWLNFKGDFSRRVLNNSAFQINQTLDVLIAGFLITGSLTAFVIGSNLGHVLLTIVGYSVANSVFPRLSKAQGDYPTQQALLESCVKKIGYWTIPTAIGAMIFAQPLLSLLFGLEGDRLLMAETVFFWTVVSLPCACLIPLYSRVFLANDDTKTPLYINFGSLALATALAAFLALVILPPEKAILGLALGNFTANTVSALLFVFLWRNRMKEV